MWGTIEPVKLGSFMISSRLLVCFCLETSLSDFTVACSTSVFGYNTGASATECCDSVTACDTRIDSVVCTESRQRLEERNQSKWHTSTKVPAGMIFLFSTSRITMWRTYSMIPESSTSPRRRLFSGGYRALDVDPTTLGNSESCKLKSSDWSRL